MELFILIVVVALALLIALVVWKARRRRLSPRSREKIARAWEHVRSTTDPIRQVLEADKVLDLALAEAGFRGSVADKLKKAGPRFSNVNAVWSAHKLRNRLAHEPGARVSVQDANNALRAFEKGIGEL